MRGGGAHQIDGGGTDGGPLIAGDRAGLAAALARRLGARLAAGPAALAAALDDTEAVVWLPDTAAPDTAAPDTVAPDTVAPDTGAPDTAAPDTGILDLLAGRPPRRLVVVSSAERYQASADHPGMVEAARHLPPPAAAATTARHWLALEEAVLARFPADRTALLILRPPPVPLAAGRERWSRLLAAPFAPAPAGFDPMMQLLDLDDLAAAVSLALERPEVTGVLNLAPAAPERRNRLLAAAGVPRLPSLTRPLAAALLPPDQPAGGPGGGEARSHTAGGLPESAALRHPWTVSGEEAKDRLGFTPHFSTAEVARRLRGRLAGQPPERPAIAPEPGRAVPDDQGQDRALIRALGRGPFRFLHDAWFRIEAEGLAELAPAVAGGGPAILVGVHRGFVPFDAMMALHQLVQAHGRYPRFLVHPGLLKAPFIAPFIRRLGGVMACRENAERLLARGEIVGLLPEGVRGAFSLYRDAYRVRPFLSDEPVRLALAHRCPILPFVTVGSAEVFPVLGKIEWRWFKRVAEWPYIPITPNLPLFPIFPLPVKWRTRYLPPLTLDPREIDAADPRQVRRASRDLRRLLQETMDGMVAARRGWF